jgi:hypothetical protein
MSTTTPTRRRWFQFSLRTLFLLVTAFAIGLGSELSYIRQRRAWVSDHYPGPLVAWCIYRKLGPAYYLPPDEVVTVPFWRRWLGDDAYHTMYLDADPSDEVWAEATRLFPEASIQVNPPQP